MAHKAQGASAPASSLRSIHSISEQELASRRAFYRDLHNERLADLIPIHNDSPNPIYVGTAMVAPGDTRVFAESDVPPHQRPEVAQVDDINVVESPAPVVDAGSEVSLTGEGDKAEPDNDAALHALLEGSVASVNKQLGELSDADLERLGDLEQLGQRRVTLLSAIAELQLQRANAAEGEPQ